MAAKLIDRHRLPLYFRTTPHGGAFNPHSMRNHFTLALLLSGALATQAQTLTNVIVTPANPTECDLLTFTFVGTMPQNASFQSFLPDFDADSLNVALTATGGGGGNGNFSQALGGLGPFPPGSYTVCVTFTLNNNLVGTDCQVITIGVGTNPYAGEYGQLENTCTGGPSIPLIGLLEGTPDTDGTWQDPDGQVVEDGLFVPGQSSAGVYTYFFDVQEPCIDASQIVFITYEAGSANAGLNSTVQTCEGFGPTINLLDTLGGTPDATGTWTFNGTAHSAIFNPLADACGAYTYTVPGVGACPPAVATVAVQCVNPPNAGNVSATNDTIVRCYNDTIELLQSLVTGEQTTGTWFTQFGFPIGQYNDSINLALNGGGRYAYVVPSVLCPSDTSFIFVVLWGDTINGCDGIGMEDVQGNVARFELMPNPAQDLVTIEVELTRSGPAQFLEVLDVDGKVVLRQGLAFNGLFARQTLVVGDLARGAYLVRIGSAEGRSVRRLMLR